MESLKQRSALAVGCKFHEHKIDLLLFVHHCFFMWKQMQYRFITNCPSFLFVRQKCLSILVWKSGSIMYVIIVPIKTAMCQHMGKARTKAHCIVTSLNVHKLTQGRTPRGSLLLPGPVTSSLMVCWHRAWWQNSTQTVFVPKILGTTNNIGA